VASSETVEPAITSVWDILSGGLRERALFVLVIGLGFVCGGWLAGPGRGAVAVRRFLAPYLRDHPVAVYSVVALLFLLWLAFIPGIDNLGQILVIVLLAGLAVVGVEVLRRRTAPRSKESDPVRARGRGPRGGLPGA
jgi:branched-subunit amino acid permease